MEPITPLNELKIYPEPNSGCWLWVGAASQDGYGTYWCRRKKKVKSAHRVVWESHFGIIPEGLELDHLCRTPSCVNPTHLEPVTRSVNVKRGLVPEIASRFGAERRKATTHCPKGHEYTPENTYHKRDHRHIGVTSRCCRACNRISSVERRAKTKSRRLAT